mmetsp:Transcript_121292/g.288124  ORF Transcript_121292/g.288124 Transcript_121292/m.288124 type:complete len:680 (-) Transcript_121292:70-2109(-)
MAGVGLAEENKVPKEPERPTEPGEAAGQAPVRAEGPKSIGSYFSWRPLPWWVCFLLGIFLLTKFQIVYNDSPCAVLGLQGPVTAADLKKAFRHLSMCTHPDRLRGRLKRTPTQEESRRGEIIFNRASTAREDLLKTQRGKQPMQCYQGELELAVLLFFQQVGRLFASLGLEDYLGFFWESVWAIITFEAGIINTLLALLWLSFVYKLLRQFGGYLWRMGILRFVLGFITTVVIGPIPTVVNFFFLPFIRIFVFLDSLRGQDRQEEQQSKKTDDPPVSGEEKKSEPQQPSTANIKLESDKDRNHLRQRKKKDNSEDKDTRNKELVNEEVNATDDSSGAPVTANGQLKPKPMPEGLWKIVTWSHKEQVKARQAAASAMQFDLLLILTKPVIPLIMLVATGQVWNGILSSMFIGHALRKWVPQMSYEAQHLFCALFGVLHTMLGVSASKLEDYANREGSKMLHLAWAWSLKDVLSVMHMCQLGAAVTALSALGNEPSYAASFASGIALRIAVGQDAFRGLGFAHTVADYFQATVRDLGVSMDAAEEVVAYSGGGIGDCGGGPFRMLFGDETLAAAAAAILKVWLLLLPALSTAQWLQRTIHAGRMLGKRYKLTRVIQRLILCLLGVLQICLFAMSELNASNGALINYWLAMLFGCAGESLLSTFDIRGPVRQIIFLLLFVMM